MDVVVVGSGPNGLAAAVAMARAGLSVTVLEANPTVGGGARTLDLGLADGLVHDVCSAIHPMAWASPFFQAFNVSVSEARTAAGSKSIAPERLPSPQPVVTRAAVNKTACALKALNPLSSRLVRTVIARPSISFRLNDFGTTSYLCGVTIANFVLLGPGVRVYRACRV